MSFVNLNKDKIDITKWNTNILGVLLNILESLMKFVVFVGFELIRKVNNRWSTVYGYKSKSLFFRGPKTCVRCPVHPSVCPLPGKYLMIWDSWTLLFLEMMYFC